LASPKPLPPSTARAVYDGEIASGADNHTLNIGLRLRW
jgi:hypothetical protein